MEYENDERGYAGTKPLHYPIIGSNWQITLPILNRGKTDSRVDEPRVYDREDDRDLRDDRRVDEDARARSASPDGRDRMDTRYALPFANS